MSLDSLYVSCVNPNSLYVSCVNPNSLTKQQKYGDREDFPVQMVIM